MPEENVFKHLIKQQKVSKIYKVVKEIPPEVQEPPEKTVKSPRRHRPITPMKFDPEINSDDFASPGRGLEQEFRAPPKTKDPYDRKKKSKWNEVSVQSFGSGTDLLSDSLMQLEALQAQIGNSMPYTIEFGNATLGEQKH